MATKLVDTRTEIETPENVTLTFELAGPGSRMTAFMIDLFVRLGIIYGLNQIIALLVPVFGTGLPIGGMLVAIFLVEWWYGALLEGFWNGRTLGKRICHLRVIKDAGYPIGFYEATIRNFLRAADILPISYGVGLICMVATRRMQRIGDLVAGTIVVHERSESLKTQSLQPTKLKPLIKAECSGAFHVSDRTLDIMDRLLSRDDELTEVRQDEIAAILAKPVARKLGTPILVGRFRHRLFLQRVLKTFSGAGPDE